MDCSGNPRPLSALLLPILFVVGLRTAAAGQSLQAGTSSGHDAAEQSGFGALDKEIALQLKYLVLGDYLQFPLCNAEVHLAEVEQAQQRFSEIQGDPTTFRAIIRHLGMTTVR